MKRYVHHVNAPSLVSGFEESVLQEKNPESRKRKLMKSLNSIKEEDDVINDYRLSVSGSTFKIDFSDGRRIIWDSDNLPVDWLDVFWQYATSYSKANTKSLSIGQRMYDEPGGLFDSTASSTVKLKL